MSWFRFALVLLALAACGTTGGGGGGVTSEGGATADTLATDVGPVKPVQGNVLVVLRTYPKEGRISTFGLVNASSENGRRLASGRATSTEVRVLPDQDMAQLLALMDKNGFSAQAQEGIALDKLRDYPGRRVGVIVVTENNRSRGIDFGTGVGGGAFADAYSNCKKLILGVHSKIEAFEVRVSTGDDNAADREFQAPPARAPDRLRR